MFAAVGKLLSFMTDEFEFLSLVRCVVFMKPIGINRISSSKSNLGVRGLILYYFLFWAAFI